MKEQHMTEQRPSQYPLAGRPDQTTIGWAVGFTLFAAIMQIMAGIFQALQGPGGRITLAVLSASPTFCLGLSGELLIRIVSGHGGDRGGAGGDVRGAGPAP
jgi:hypothetical protein